MALGRNPFERRVSKATEELLARGRRQKIIKEEPRGEELEALLEEYKRRLDDAMNQLESLSKTQKQVGFFDVAEIIKRAMSGFTLPFAPFRPSTYSRIIRAFQTVMYSDAVDEFGYDPKFEELIKPFFGFLYKKWWRIKTEGVNNVPSEGGVLLVSNHSGTLPADGAMVKYALLTEHPASRDVRPLAENFVYYFPFLGAFMNRIGGVRACQENAEMLLRRGDVILVFPEGVKGVVKYFSQRYKLQRFGRGGFVKLAIRTRVPMVPVAVVGAEEIYPTVFKIDFLGRIINLPTFPVTLNVLLLGPLGIIPFPSKWYIKFGEPMDMSKYPLEAAEDDILINQISQKVRAQIQEMLIELLKRRKSIWW